MKRSYKEKTDLDGVKAVAKLLLHQEICKTDYSPVIVQHPFTNSGIVVGSLLGRDGLVDITESREDFEKWKSILESWFEKADSASGIFWMVNKPYRLFFVKLAAPFLSTNEFSALFADAWIGSEAPNMDPNVSKKELVRMFKNAEPTALMTEEELTVLRSLDDPVTVYRGVTPYNENDLLALSWTLNRDKAEWFAKRFHEDGRVYEAEISKEHILAYFSRRGEEETVVDPRFLQKIVLSSDQGQAEGITLM